MNSEMLHINFRLKHENKFLQDWLKIYKFGFWVASAGWIVTMVGFIYSAY